MHDRSLLCDELGKGWEGGTSFHDKLDTPSSLPFSVQILTSHASERNSIRRADHLEDFFNQRMVDGKRVVANMLLKKFKKDLRAILTHVLKKMTLSGQRGNQRNNQMSNMIVNLVFSHEVFCSLT